MSKTCPKCAADYNGKSALKESRYWCQSSEWEDGDFYQSPECVRRERDQILEQSPSSVRRERDQLLERNRELEEKIRRLEESIGEAYAEMRKHFPSVTAVFDRSVWEKAKEVSHE